MWYGDELSERMERHLDGIPDLLWIWAFMGNAWHMRFPRHRIRTPGQYRLTTASAFLCAAITGLFAWDLLPEGAAASPLGVVFRVLMASFCLGYVAYGLWWLRETRENARG